MADREDTDHFFGHPAFGDAPYGAAAEEVCPDCKQPVSTHELYRVPRCPVVRFNPRPDAG